MTASRVDLVKFPPKALTFDVFGTVVNWRKTVISTLIASAAAATSSSSRSASIDPGTRRRLSELEDEDWAVFAQQWRNSYKVFTRGYNPDEDEWLDIDTHHRLSLIKLLKQWQLEGLYDEVEVEQLSQVWHFLEPWPDASAGLRKLGAKFITSTLSNGNQSLLKDLNEHGDLGFQLLQSSADFKAYKPHARTYRGAAQRIGVKSKEIAMVAAHLNDLRAARSLGFRTIYVERQQEEDWSRDQEEYKDAKNWVDMWVTEPEDGFLEVARRFGIY